MKGMKGEKNNYLLERYRESKNKYWRERELANIWGKIGSWQILLVKQEMDALR